MYPRGTPAIRSSLDKIQQKKSNKMKTLFSYPMEISVNVNDLLKIEKKNRMMK